LRLKAKASARDAKGTPAARQSTGKRAASRASLSADPFRFRSALKASPDTCRSRPLAETEARALAAAKAIPVTRISDLTPLDPLGLPAVVAVTPLARDLTTHAGKGLDLQAARVSALMEAIERASAEDIAEARTRRASYRALARSRGGLRPLDPRRFDLPTDSTYREDREFSWVVARELISGSDALLPLDLALNPPREGLLRHADTNGLASGNSVLEAVLHALCEVVERDTLSQIEFGVRFGATLCTPTSRRVRDTSLPAFAEPWLERVRENGLDLVVHHLPSDIEIPTLRAVVLDPAFPAPSGPRPAYFPGFGTHPDTRVALARALTEAIQSRLGFVQAARDSFNTLASSPELLTRRRTDLFPGERIEFSTIQSFESPDVLADFHAVCRALARAGFHEVYAVELTQPELALPVVRVRVPGLACFLVNEQRVGFRCLRHLV
jgi:ribosomal protein S12 methylthiotransferase accessory factor